MCWSPERIGAGLLQNPQKLLTATLPILGVWLVGPLLHLHTRRLLRVGGAPTRVMLEPRMRQLRQGEVLAMCPP